MLTLPKSRMAIIAALFAVVPLQAGAQESPVRAMMEESGMVEQLAGMGDEFEAGFLKLGTTQMQMPRENLEALAAIAGRVFNGEGVTADLETSLEETLAPEDIAAMREFYATDFGKDVRRMETEAISPAGKAEMEAERDALKAEIDGNPARAALLRRMDDTLLASDIGLSLVVTALEAMMAAGVESQNPGASEGALEQYRREMAPQREQMLTAMREETLTVFAYTYRSMTDAELESYVEFLETDEARANYAAFYAAMDEIFKNRGREMGKEFAAWLVEKPI